MLNSYILHIIHLMNTKMMIEWTTDWLTGFGSYKMISYYYYYLYMLLLLWNKRLAARGNIYHVYLTEYIHRQYVSYSFPLRRQSRQSMRWWKKPIVISVLGEKKIQNEKHLKQWSGKQTQHAHQMISYIDII